LGIKKRGYGQYFMQFDNLLKGHKGDDVACMGFIWDLVLFRRNKSLYKYTLFVPFEDIMMPIPSGYDTILRTQYGNYLTPAKASSYHGGFAYLDTEKSFKDYLPVIRKRAKYEQFKYIIGKLKGILRFGFSGC
jgi:lipopolysaccharide cholinephosphotransferase